MDEQLNPSGLSRRGFLKASAGAAASAAAGASMMPGTGRAERVFKQSRLQVWSCGGLAEAFIPANKRFSEMSGVDIAYTGAFAAALGKSLLGSATTEVFGGRVLDLAKKLRKAGKMRYFKPLCFTSYVLVTPRGNPGGIQGIHDLGRHGVRVILAPQASPPGGKAVSGLLKKAGVLEKAMANAVVKGSCVQRTMEQLISGDGDVSVVEKRVTKLPAFKDMAEVIPIPEKYFPPPPLTFTIGVLDAAADTDLADHYVDFICSAEGQAFFETAGFIPALSDKGQEMTERLGVKDV
ncbi:MAG TPA: molybdenum ABC transporter substrate-binding protein [Desulfobacteraceae bacterium]|nr:molybdenum ABC transporter substrate-binding protein [Desulfobacteraceae bacterium]